DEAISPARLLPRDLTNGRAQGILRLAHRTVTDAGAREPREPKRAPLGDVICGSQLPDDLAPRPGRHNLFPRTSFSAWRLRAWSAPIRFSWRFSSSSCLSRFASETSMPPYFRFQAYRVSRLMPSRRHSSRTFAPASASLTAATFCSSVNLLLRMTPPRSVRRSQIISGSGFGGQLNQLGCPAIEGLRSTPVEFTNHGVAGLATDEGECAV